MPAPHPLDSASSDSGCVNVGRGRVGDGHQAAAAAGGIVARVVEADGRECLRSRGNAGGQGHAGGRRDDCEALQQQANDGLPGRRGCRPVRLATGPPACSSLFDCAVCCWGGPHHVDLLATDCLGCAQLGQCAGQPHPYLCGCSHRLFAFFCTACPPPLWLLHLLACQCRLPCLVRLPL